jgi:hypothetical protein
MQRRFAQNILGGTMRQKISKLVLFTLLGSLAVGALAQQSGSVTLIDCAKNAGSLKCKRLDPKQAGGIGDGPAFAQGIGDEITGGFVRGNKLIVSSQPTQHGAIIEVDLKTGNRTLIAGSVDTSEYKGSGVKYKDFNGKEQEVYLLDGISGVRPLANGNYAALIATTLRLVILEVDAKTGDSKLLWASNVSGDASQKTFENLPSEMFCASSGENDNRPNIGGSTMEVAKDGSFYVWARDNPTATGLGMYQIKDGVCKPISTYSSAGKNKTGSGFMLTASSTIDTNASLLMPDGKIMTIFSSFTAGTALMSWDPVTGSRTALSFKGSTIAKSKGKGDDNVGRRGLAINADGIYTVDIGAFNLQRIDPATGDRTSIPIKSGPLNQTNGRLDDDVQNVWAIPNSSLLLISFNNAIMLVDPKTGSSNVLSY